MGSRRPLFALYLDVQKQLLIDDLTPDEIKGRWKSFVGRWNRGELAEGWYDPSTWQKANDAVLSEPAPATRARRATDRPSPEYDDASRSKWGDRHEKGSDEEEEDDDLVGPALPSAIGQGRRMGPAIPDMQDLALRRETEREEAEAAHDELRQARKADKAFQKAALDELVPRAAAGTHERRVEKKRDVNDKMRSFRDKSPTDEVPESDLLGGDDDGRQGFKVQKKEMERKKNERELRKEDFLRARAEEREERMREYRDKEDKTMALLKALARQHYG